MTTPPPHLCRCGSLARPWDYRCERCVEREAAEAEVVDGPLDARCEVNRRKNHAIRSD